MYTFMQAVSVACASFAILVPYHGANTTRILCLVLYLISRYVLDAVLTFQGGETLPRCLFMCIYSEGALLFHTGLLKNSITKPGIAITLSYTLPLVLDLSALYDCFATLTMHAYRT